MAVRLVSVASGGDKGKVVRVLRRCGISFKHGWGPNLLIEESIGLVLALIAPAKEVMIEKAIGSGSEVQNAIAALVASHGIVHERYLWDFDENPRVFEALIAIEAFLDELPMPVRSSSSTPASGSARPRRRRDRERMRRASGSDT